MDKNRFFFQHYGLTEHDLEHYLAAALSAGGDYCDLYFEYLSSTSLMVDESMVKSASQGISAGCGIRVIAGERTGYAYTDDLSVRAHSARRSHRRSNCQWTREDSRRRLPGKACTQFVSSGVAFGGRGNHSQSRVGDACGSGGASV